MRRRHGSGDAIVITSRQTTAAPRSRGGTRSRASDAASDDGGVDMAVEYAAIDYSDVLEAAAPGPFPAMESRDRVGEPPRAPRAERHARSDRLMRGVANKRGPSPTSTQGLSVGDVGTEDMRSAGASTYSKPAGLAMTMRPRQDSGAQRELIGGIGAPGGHSRAADPRDRIGPREARQISDEPRAVYEHAERPTSAAVSELAIDVRAPVSRFGTDYDVVTGLAGAASMEPFAAQQQRARGSPRSPSPTGGEASPKGARAGLASYLKATTQDELDDVSSKREVTRLPRVGPERGGGRK